MSVNMIWPVVKIMQTSLVMEQIFPSTTTPHSYLDVHLNLHCPHYLELIFCQKLENFSIIEQYPRKLYTFVGPSSKWNKILTLTYSQKPKDSNLASILSMQWVVEAK